MNLFLINEKQKGVLITGSLLIALMLLFPPWEYFNNEGSGRSFAGHHFITTPPALKSPQEMFGVPELRETANVIVRIDKLLLIFQWLLIMPSILGLSVLLSNASRRLKIIFGVLPLVSVFCLIVFVVWWKTN